MFASLKVNQDQVSGGFAGILDGMKVGDVSKPFKSSKGLMVVKVLGIKPSSTKPFASVQDQIKKLLIHQKTEQIFTTKGQTLTNATYTNPTSLAPAAKALGLTVQQSSLMTKDGEPKGLFSNKKKRSCQYSIPSLPVLY